MIKKVEYKIDTYEGVMYISCNEDDPDEVVIETAKKRLPRRLGPLPDTGHERFRVIRCDLVSRKD